VAANSLIQIANHFRGTQVLSRPSPKVHAQEATQLDLRDIKGPGKRQTRARDCHRRPAPPFAGSPVA